MANFLVTIRPFISLSFPFIFLHYFSSYFYHISLWELLKWWFFNLTKADNSGPILFGMFFAVLILSMAFSGFMNVFYLGLVGEKQELVYLGHSKQSTAVYYDVDDWKKKPMNSYDVDRKYNGSFDNLYRSQLFKKDPGTTNMVGTKANRFHFSSVISVMVGMIVFSMIGALIYNAFIFNVYQINPTDVAIPSDEGAQIAFDHIIQKYGFSRGWYYGSMLIILFLWLGFAMSVPSNQTSDQVIKLPSNIQENAKISGIPTDIDIIYKEVRRSNNSTTTDTVDSGWRYVNFEFTEGFKHSVYVALRIKLNGNEDLLDTIQRNIVNKNAMELTVTEGLGVALPSVVEE